MPQGLLPLRLQTTYNVHDFYVSTCNLEAYKVITNKCTWQNGRILLVGESGSGKSHLVSIWQKENDAVCVKNVDAILDKYGLIIEDIENFADEMLLLSLINVAAENNLQLLMTGRCVPRYIMQDLQSRMNATYKVLIKNPDYELIKVLLQKQFADLQLKVDPEIVEYIASHAKVKTFHSIKVLVTLIDQICAQYKREVSVSMVKRIVKFI
ncbi:putative Chromosomal replication initiator proteinDnaA like protein [Alphaproteobacteria bacterium]